MTAKIIIFLVILYFVFEFGKFAYRYSHLPALPAIDQSGKTFGIGSAIRYIAAGDSTAVGMGASTTENTYPYKIAEDLAKTNTIIYKNIAVKGYKTKDVLESQVEQIIAFKPDIVTISMGGNDATHLVSKKEVLKNYKSIISKLKEATSAKIYIANVPNFNGASILPWFYIQLIEHRSKSQNREILALEDERIKIVNVHDFGWAESPYSDRAKTYSADHFHPNDLGYQNWTNAFLEKIHTQF